MSQLTDAEIVSALRRAVPEPPVPPDRVSAVHHRARVHRRNQLSAVALTLVAVVGAGAAVVSERSPSHTYAGLTAPLVPMTGIPVSLYRPSRLPTISAGAPCPTSAAHTFPAGQGFSASYTGIGDGPLALTGDGQVGVNFDPPANERYFSNGQPGTKVIWRLSDSYSGPVLIRGARLDGTGTVNFDRYLGAVDNGSIQGTPFPTLGYITSAGTGPTSYPSGLAVSSPGCYGIQVDGTSFSEVITFSVTSVHQ
ncbi:hypothetical protein acdb102_45810 [Acidothermaceae bacterium B102]|nr:hypothetical protein acdb102_45810 [Acidothermaceae bacterium B102]